MDLPRIPIPEYQYITKEEDARAALSIIDRYPEFEFDTEGTALDPYKCKTTLFQIGTGDNVFVFDVRADQPDVSVHGSLFEPLLTDKSKCKILQNAAYDMSVLKVQYGYYLKNVYDTFVSEKLLNLGRIFTRASLQALIKKYLGFYMPKEAQSTFSNYYQPFTREQLDYAATDVIGLSTIKDQQLFEIDRFNLQKALDLELDFITPMVEMQLNGIMMDEDKWQIIIEEASDIEKDLFFKISKDLQKVNKQTTLFDVPIINIGSNAQLLEHLHRLGIKVPNTQRATLEDWASYPIVQDLLEWRGVNKLVTTYGEELLAKKNPVTGRIHTSFQQMVDTGRMSSRNPNLQNIPGKQKYRTCFVAPSGKALITADMSGAELRILGNMSMDPAFIEAYSSGIDVHTANAARIFNVPYKGVSKEQRKASKAISFGLVYGLSAHGLSARLRITKERAEEMIASYFAANQGVYNWLESAKRNALNFGYSETIIGRKRFYDLPALDNPDRKIIIGSIERKAMNHPIQGSNADTIKRAMVRCFEALEAYGDKAKLILTVHDEIIIECDEDLKHEVGQIVSDSLVKGFGDYFDVIPMEADALISPCWMKGECEYQENKESPKCGGNNFKLVPDSHYKTKLVCATCGTDQ